MCINVGRAVYMLIGIRRRYYLIDTPAEQTGHKAHGKQHDDPATEGHADPPVLCEGSAGKGSPHCGHS